MEYMNFTDERLKYLEDEILRIAYQNGKFKASNGKSSSAKEHEIFAGMSANGGSLKKHLEEKIKVSYQKGTYFFESNKI